MLVQSEWVFEYLVVGEVGGPAVGIGDVVVEVAVGESAGDGVLESEVVAVVVFDRVGMSDEV